MTLADLIRGTAAAECPTVARVAEVAVANAQKAMLSHQDLETNVESAEFATATLATFATVAGLRAADEAVIRRWLTAIGETDERVIEETILCCKTDEQSRDWALEQARANQGARNDLRPNSDEGSRTDETLADMAGAPAVDAACKRCRHVTRYLNCSRPVEAGLSDRFCLIDHPEGGRGCAHFEPAGPCGNNSTGAEGGRGCAVFEPDASLREGYGLPKI